MLIESDAEPMKAASGRGVEACQDAALGMQGTASAMNADLSRKDLYALNLATDTSKTAATGFIK